MLGSCEKKSLKMRSFTNNKATRTKFELLGELRGADVGYFNLGEWVEVWFPFECPQGPSTDGVLVTKVDVVVRNGEGKVGH